MRFWILCVVATIVNAIATDAPSWAQGAIFGAAVSGFYILGQHERRG